MIGDMRNLLAAVVLTFALSAQAADLRSEAEAGLKRAVTFFHDQVAIEGGYVYCYSADLKLREGEGKTGATTVWVEPPGTPAVGMALLQAYERTKQPYLLAAANDAGMALVRGQFQSGGWNDHIDFDPAARKKFAYLVDGKYGSKARNISTFDDNKTQSALRLIMELDRVTDFKDKTFHNSAMYALKSVLGAQRANGAWSQVWDGPVAQDDPAELRASIPKDYPHQYPGGDYWWLYTLNDRAMSDTIEMLLTAAEIYNDVTYRDAAVRGGKFLLRAQLPEPQPAWSQQYDREMHPAWARKFEPPAVTGLESQRVLRTLMRLHVATGDAAWLEPIPRAIAWFKRSALPDGRMARFYELNTNRPLYMTSDYKLTFDDSDTPTHYGFKVKSDIVAIEQEYEAAKAGTPVTKKKSRPSDAEVQAVLAAMDDRGAWVEQGTLKYHKIEGPLIRSETFIKNVGLLSEYLSAGKP